MSHHENIERLYRNHRGGRGAIIMVQAYNERIDRYATGAFSSVDLAKQWAMTFPGDWIFVFSPMIIDDPDWGLEMSGAQGVPSSRARKD